MMGFQVLMVLALLAAFAIPMIFGMAAWAMIASHLCILAATLAIFFGVLHLKKGDGRK